MNIEHIENFLLDEIAANLDLSDLGVTKDEQLARHKITRSLVALALSQVSTLSIKEASSKVTDQYDDYGIDGFFLDAVTKSFWIVQAKSSKTGTGSIGSGEVHKFIAGVQKMLDKDFSGFNSKITDRKAEIVSALESTDITFKLLIVNLGSEIQQKSEEPLKSFLEKQNRDLEEDWVEFEQLSLDQITDIITKYQLSKDIELRLSLSHWGVYSSPFKSYYGTVSAQEVGSWFDKHGSFLFSKNIRNFLGTGSVNSKITQTLENDPQSFYYLNNGITIICEELNKTRHFGNETHAGNFVCTKAQIINGAQTVGSIGRVFKKNPEILSSANVTVKIISVGGASPELSDRITVAANSQNKIEAMDFASMTEVQIRLEREMLKRHGVKYLRLRGNESSSNQTITLDSAAAALCCCNLDVQYCVTYKRERNKIWEDVNSDLYKEIFPEDLSTHYLLNADKLLNLTESFLTLKAQSTESSREKLLCLSGNRFLAHMLFHSMSKKQQSQMQSLDLTKEIDKLRPQLEKTYSAVLMKIESDEYQGAQLSRLFISKKRVADLRKSLL